MEKLLMALGALACLVLIYLLERKRPRLTTFNEMREREMRAEMSAWTPPQQMPPAPKPQFKAVDPVRKARNDRRKARRRAAVAQ